ncbi:phage tail protein [Achromobacter xylosoxidans]|uniref:phage tail protein n=1 Tax=Alcaligenes xylosoxydans xylosoxydans TaxID=85698 RepID=UPI0022B8C91C|nr:phage tail protein [Achromobacter xylosoxidans]MCZ8437195.1 phage tail protein [Achromobacter xylosoxidans]
MTRLLTLRRNLARLLTRDEVDDNFVNVASDFSGAVDPATLTGAYVAPYMRWADTGTGWLKRRNAANNAWEPEQRLLRRTVQPFSADELPTVDSGPVYVNGQGMAEFDAAAGMYRVKSPVPVGAVAWWPLRSSIPAGRLPADGQTVSRATFPDLAAMVEAGTLPVVSEADWQADPLKRGSYTLGDGSTTIRVPDLNGKSAGAVGAVFLRGDGARSAGSNGLLQVDIVGPHAHTTPMFSGAGSSSTWASGGGASTTYTVNNGTGIGPETRPLNATGVWTIQAFGAVTNPGSVDAAQLASDYAALSAAFQSLSAAISFAIVYPNGGTAAAPANITVNSRYVVANPFPGYRVLCQLEIRVSGKWGYPGSFVANSAGNYFGCAASQFDDGDIVVQTAVNYLTSDNPAATGHAFLPTPATLTVAPARVKVWRVRGLI